jgi:predicted nuclease of predicted toxin-antitoxin system
MIKYLLDENLSRRLAEKLTHRFIGITHVAHANLMNSTDGEIWQFAKNNHLTIITKDNDFNDMSHLYGCPPKVIKLNCGNKTTDYISSLLLNHFQVIEEFVSGNNCYMEIL